MRELSILAVRGRDGAAAFYPLVENQHRDGILRRSLAALDYVGVLAIELFEVTSDELQVTSGLEQSDSSLVVNEMAPRVHNSGHWTIEGAETSQFENHLRAILGRPLGSVAPRGHVAMVNLIGDLPDLASVLAIPGAHLHLYAKAPRPGRKIGHITLRADDPALLDERLALLY
jgi:5-(carboxyamino)imidazole ribonucleotide synthase